MLHSITLPSKSKLQSLQSKAVYTLGFIVGTTTKVAQVSGAIIKHDTKVYLSNIKHL